MSILAKAVLHLHHFTSKDSCRDNLAHIEIRRTGKNEISATATNGHILAHVKYRDEHAADWPSGKSFYISRDSAKGLLTAYPKTPNVVVGAELLADGVSFPDTDAVYPKGKPEPCARIGYDAHYFDLIRKFLDKINKPGRTFPKQGIVVEPYGELSPTVIRPSFEALVPFDTVRFILMPVRC